MNDNTKNKLINLLTTTFMTQQAINSMNLYRGGNPATIEQLLHRQKISVVNELKQHFGAKDLHELSILLAFSEH